MTAQEQRQQVIRKVLTAPDVEAEMTKALTAQGKAPQGARMQIQFILACSKSKIIRNDPMPSLADDIIRTQRDKVIHFGEGAYPLSEKQIAVIARHFERIVSRNEQ